VVIVGGGLYGGRVLFGYVLLCWSRGSAVGIATDCGLDDRGVGVESR
jgi:hypothetical protein